jgi:hypothetical protein
MFLVDDFFKEAMSFLGELASSNRKEKKEAASHGRKAMRKLASSLDDVIILLEKGINQLELKINDREAFFQILAKMLDEELLYKFCHEAGICEDLRIAQDELRLIFKQPYSPSRKEKSLYKLMDQLDGYERHFIQAIREFLNKSKNLRNLEEWQINNLQPSEVLAALKARLEGLHLIENNINNLLNDLTSVDSAI